MVPWKAGPPSVTPRCRGWSPPGQHPIGSPDHGEHVVVLHRDLCHGSCSPQTGGLPGSRTRPGPSASRGRTSSAVEDGATAFTPIRNDTPWDRRRPCRCPSPGHRTCGCCPGSRARHCTSLDRLEHVLRLEVNIGDHRDTRLLGDDRQRVRVLIRRAGNANDARLRPSARRSGWSVALMSCVCRRHGLDGHSSATAHGNVAHHDATRLLARERRRRDFGHTKIDFTHRVIIAHSGLPFPTRTTNAWSESLFGQICVTPAEAQPSDTGFTMSATIKITLIATSRPPTTPGNGNKASRVRRAGSSAPRTRATVRRTPS